MICRNCGTEIADKAIVCYRCGVGTADPVRRPVEIRRRRRSPLLVAAIFVLALVLALLAAWRYHVLGLEYSTSSGYSVHLPVNLLPILIDFASIHA